jgi:hypothetical protein
MKEIEIRKKRKDKLLDLNINGLINDSEFKKRNEEFNINISELEKQIEKYSQLNDIKLDGEKQLKYIKKALEKEVDFKNHFDEKIAEQILEKIEVYNTKISNLIHLKVILKSGMSIPVYYILNKNMRLYPSIHMIRADIETEIAPIVGTEKQSEELVNYLLKEFENEPAKIWESNMFGKTLHELVNEGLHNKLFKMPEDAQLKLQETLQRIINEGNGGLICIIL